MTEPEPTAYSLPYVAAVVGVSRRTLEREIDAGRLESFKVGRRRLITSAAMHAWIKTYQAEEVQTE